MMIQLNHDEVLNMFHVWLKDKAYSLRTDVEVTGFYIQCDRGPNSKLKWLRIYCRDKYGRFCKPPNFNEKGGKNE